MKGALSMGVAVKSSAAVACTCCFGRHSVYLTLFSILGFQENKSGTFLSIVLLCPPGPDSYDRQMHYWHVIEALHCLYVTPPPPPCAPYFALHFDENGHYCAIPTPPPTLRDIGNQRFVQGLRQPIDLSTNHSTNQPTSQPINESINQPLTPGVTTTDPHLAVRTINSIGAACRSYNSLCA